MKRIVLWFLSTVSVVVLLFGYHTSTSSTMALSAPTSIVSGTTGSTAGAGAGSGSGGAGGSGDDGAGAGTSGSGTSGSGHSASSHGGWGGGSGSGTSSTKASHTPAPATRTVTGDVINTAWGPVQVQLVLKGGTITAVHVLQHPSGNPRSDEINAYALPILIHETTQAQGAGIDMVSGATFTSTGYEQSLQSALDQAGA